MFYSYYNSFLPTDVIDSYAKINSDIQSILEVSKYYLLNIKVCTVYFNIFCILFIPILATSLYHTWSSSSYSSII